MSSLSLRNAAAAVVLFTLLGLAAAPAAAQPHGIQEPSRVEMDFATRVWLWLAQMLGPRDAAPAKSLSLQNSSDPSAPVALNRGGTYDPNG